MPRLCSVPDKLVRPTLNSDNLVFFDDLSHLLAVWIGVFALLAFMNLRRSRPAFLVYGYLALFFVNHWFGAMAPALPGSPFDVSSNPLIGFQESTYGLIAFAVGALFMPVQGYVSQRGRRAQSAKHGLQDFFEARRVARYSLA